MTEQLINFEKNLKQQIGCYKKIVGLEKEKQQALVANNIQTLEFITAQEEKILLEVSRLEEERLSWADFFAKQTGKELSEITLGDIAASYPELEEVRRELDGAIGELKELHEDNTKLLENAVNLVRFTIQALTQERSTTYANPGEKTAGHIKNKASMIDKSI